MLSIPQFAFCFALSLKIFSYFRPIIRSLVCFFQILLTQWSWVIHLSHRRWRNAIFSYFFLCMNLFFGVHFSSTFRLLVMQTLWSGQLNAKKNPFKFLAPTPSERISTRLGPCFCLSLHSQWSHVRPGDQETIDDTTPLQYDGRSKNISDIPMKFLLPLQSLTDQWGERRWMVNHYPNQWPGMVHPLLIQKALQNVAHFKVSGRYPVSWAQWLNFLGFPVLLR